MTINKYDLIIVFGYFIVLFFIGFLRKKEDQVSQIDYILSGRKLSLPGFVMTLVSTWYGAILGVGENTYLYGIQTWFIFALPYYVFAIAYAIWLTKVIWNKNILSIPDIFRKSYGDEVGIISAIFIFVLSSPAPYILSLGVLINFIFQIKLVWCLLIATIFSTIYVWRGGLSSIIKTDYLQLILMFLGFFALIGFSWYNSVSPFMLFKSLPDSHIDPLGGNSIQYVLVWFFIAVWTIIDPNFFQRCAAVKNPEIAKKGLLISVCFWFLFDLMTLTAGLYAYIFIIPENPVMTYPLLGFEVLPPGFLGLFLISIFAIIMSTIDSMSFVNAITIGRDIFWRIRKKDSNKNPVFLIRRGLFAVSLLSILLSLAIPSVVKMIYTIGSIIIPGLILPFINALKNFNIRTTKIQAILWICIPIAISSIALFMSKLNFEFYPDIEPFYPGMFTSIIIFSFLKINTAFKKEI